MKPSPSRNYEDSILRARLQDMLNHAKAGKLGAFGEHCVRQIKDRFETLLVASETPRKEWKEPERVRYPADHEWHVAINKFSSPSEGEKPKDFPHFMYEAKTMADEVPRMAYILRLERTSRLPQQHQQCSHQPVEKIENELTCCLGVKCRECPHLLALEKAERMTPEQIDVAKAWTCAAHIVSKGGDVAREGYILSTSDRLYWDRVYESLSADLPNGGERGQSK